VIPFYRPGSVSAAVVLEVPLYCAEALALAFSGCRAEADESRAGKYLATTD
jgi:hypothetical protein